MGNIQYIPQKKEEKDLWWTNGQQEFVESRVHENKETISEAQGSSQYMDEQRLNQLSEKNKTILNEFKYEMERKHEKRREILAAKRKEFQDLREEVERLRKENKMLISSSSNELLKKFEDLQKDHQITLKNEEILKEKINETFRENTALKSELKDKIEQLGELACLLDKNRELRVNIADMQKELQNLNSIVVEFEKEREEYKAHVLALKDVINVSKRMLLIREDQLKELKQKVESIERSFAEKEINVISQDLRKEYERQLESIRNLKALYEERQRTDQKEKKELKSLLDDANKELEAEQKRHREATERISELEELNSQKYDQIKSLESNIGLTKAECRQYQAELTVINQLFSEILLGFNSSQEINLDKLSKHLEEHHELLQNIVISEISSEASSALPKVLLDLVNEVHAEEQNKKENCEDNTNNNTKLETIIEESESQTSTDQINSVEEIVELLPKVWRVLIQLLSHQKAPTNVLSTDEPNNENPCYKTVHTSKGPSLVLSVSQTFMRLKDLILEKKCLEKETGHLKQLNTHLENRLQDQEKRLVMVTSELNETWHVVGKLQKQHQLLHTQEKILRYELAQKRKLLSTLKEELEHSREKWRQAREKNSKTEKQWRQLRHEFASRRTTTDTLELNNSQESGYSDDRSSDDEPGYETDVLECAQGQSKKEENKEDNPETCGPLGTQIILNEISQSNNTSTSNTVVKPTDSSNLSLSEKESLSIENTSRHLVSTIIEEAIASIFENSTRPPVTTSLNQEVDLQKDTKEKIKDRVNDHINKENPGPSNVSIHNNDQLKSVEEILVTKEERLKRLEGQCKALVNKVNETTQKSIVISNKLDDLHEAHAETSGSQQFKNRSDEQNKK